MAWDIVTTGSAVSSTGIKPTLNAKRDTSPGGASTPDKGRKPTAWSDFGTLPLLGGVNQLGEFTAYYLDSKGHRTDPSGWSFPFNSATGSGPRYDFLTEVEGNVMSDASEEAMASLLPDTTYTIYFYATDQHEETGSGIPGTCLWGAFSNGISGDADLSDATAIAKTYAGDATLPALRARWIGATKAAFHFGINVNTIESTCTIYLRWREGRHTDTTTWDGQVEVAGTAKGTKNETYTADISDLEANKEYTVWLHLVRLTENDTLWTSSVSYITTEGSDDYLVADDANVSLTLDLQNANFNFRFTIYRVQRTSPLFIPRTWVEVIKTSDWDVAAGGAWPVAKIIRSPYIGPFYPDEDAITVVGRLVSNVSTAHGRRRGGATTVTGGVSAITDVEGLTQSTAYSYRIALENPSGTVYPVSGFFTTPDFDATRQVIASRFTHGSY